MSPHSEHSSNLLRAFFHIRSRIDALHIPAPCFCAISYDGHTMRIAESGVSGTITDIVIRNESAFEQELLSWCTERSTRTTHKAVAVVFVNYEPSASLRTRIWLDYDVVTFQKTVPTLTDDALHAAADELVAHFREELVPELLVGNGNVVRAHPLVDVETYRTATDPAVWSALEKEKKRFGDSRILFISATPQGGGVALMRHALIRFFETIGVSAHWCVMEPDTDAFLITKTKFHNVLQNVAPPDTTLTETDVEQYARWTEENVHIMREEINRAQVIVIDDPQPSGLIPHIRTLNKEARIIYRSHIQLEAERINTRGTPQYDVWKTLWQYIQHADLFVSHPIHAFVPDIVPQERRVYMPATTDQHDGLNKGLTEQQMDYYSTIFEKLLLEQNQTPLDPARPYFAQVARFDPSKGIPDVIEAWRSVRCRLADEGHETLPQLVIVGNGSIDDPDGVPIYNLTKSMLEDPVYDQMRHDVKVLHVPHIDQLLNTILRRSYAVLQLSHREGFEVKVTEALMKGKPVVAYATGGIPLQMEDGVTGFLIPEIGNITAVADALYTLYTDHDRYETMSVEAQQRARRDVLTVPNALNWLFLANELLAGKLTDVHHPQFVKKVECCKTGLTTRVNG